MKDLRSPQSAQSVNRLFDALAHNADHWRKDNLKKQSNTFLEKEEIVKKFQSGLHKEGKQNGLKPA